MGCLRDDYSDCPTGVYITFESINPKNVYAEQVERVNLYFYDKAGDLIHESYYTEDELRPEDHAAYVQNIPDGDYHVLAIINDNIYTETSQISKYSTVRSRVSAEALNYNAEPFFSSEKDITVVNDPMNIRTELMRLDNYKNNIYVHLVYDDSKDPYMPTPGTNLQAKIEGSNNEFIYSSRTCNSDTKLVSEYWYRSDNHETYEEDHRLPEHPAAFSISTMHLWHGSDITITITEVPDSEAAMPMAEGDEPEFRIIKHSLTDLLKERLDDNGDFPYDSNEELLFYDEFHIYLSIDNGGSKYWNGETYIKVGDWDTVKGEIGI